jgi:glycosyltransferase involved in cell wall biosynthesis
VTESTLPTVAEEQTRLPSVSVIVPAYNEAPILMWSMTTLHDHLHTLDDRYDWELVVVDDGSTDETPEIADLFASRHDRTRVLHHPRNYNLGQALRFGFASCTGDYIVTMDCDLSYTPDHIERMLDHLRETKAKIVIASPYLKGGTTENVPPFRRWVSRTANRFLSFSVKGDLSTLTSMVRAYDRKFVNSLNLKAMDIEVNTEILYKARVLRASIEEIPGHLRWAAQPGIGDRQRSSSIHVGRSTAAYIFNGFLFRPVLLFVLPGCVLFAAFIVLLIGGLISGSSATLVVAAVCSLLSIQLVSLGILCLQAKRYFEELFHLGTNVLRGTRPEWQPEELSPSSNGAGRASRGLDPT